MAVPPRLCCLAGQRGPHGAPTTTFLMGGVVPARAPVTPVALCRAPPAAHLEAVRRAEEEATVLRGAGLAGDAGDLAGERGLEAPKHTWSCPGCGRQVGNPAELKAEGPGSHSSSQVPLPGVTHQSPGSVLGRPVAQLAQQLHVRVAAGHLPGHGDTVALEGDGLDALQGRGVQLGWRKIQGRAGEVPQCRGHVRAQGCW